MNKKEWPKVDMDFMHEFIKLHNMVCVGKKMEDDMRKFVLNNKDKFNNPDYLQIFSEAVQIFDHDYYKDNHDLCKVFYDFMVSNTEWRNLDFGLRTAIRLGSFEDDFKAYLDNLK